MTWWYLSFASDEKFLGGCVVEILATGTPGIIDAVREAHRKGCNPGGAVRGGALKPDVPLPRAEWRNRLMSKEDIDREMGGAAKWPADVPGTRDLDDPELDGTDFAHPAWWRGSDEAVAHVVRQLQSAIDGEDTGAGTLGHPGLEAIRRWILSKR